MRANRGAPAMRRPHGTTQPDGSIHADFALDDGRSHRLHFDPSGEMVLLVPPGPVSP